MLLNIGPKTIVAWLLGLTVVWLSSRNSAPAAEQPNTIRNDCERTVRRRPLRLLVDEYHHKARPEGISQGLSLRPDAWANSYHYSTDANATPNGLFVLKQVLADDFRTEISTSPIDANLSDRADAFMLVCPKKAEAGNPHPVTQADAEHLEAFVAQGGILILVHNSANYQRTVTSDFAGMNLIAGKFGLKFDFTSTRILMIPIASDHPVFSGPRWYLFGGGSTVSVEPSARPRATILLESINPEVAGPVAVRVRYGKGSVLALGDAGSLGNPSLLRGRIGQFETCRQMFHCLLPEGPLPAYGWREGMEVEVKLWHETATAGYPEKLRILNLPLDSAAQTQMVKPRPIDLEAAAKEPGGDTSAAAMAEKAKKFRFALVRARWHAQYRLRIGPNDGRAFAATWIGEKGQQIRARLTPRGQFLDAAPGGVELAPWRWALLGEVVLAPLDPQAQPGNSWTCPASALLPQVQLHPAPILRRATASFHLEGCTTFRGRKCFVVTKTVRADLSGIEPQELVEPEYADYFGSQTVRIREGGQVSLATTWVDASTKLPLRTELLVSTGLVWTDRDMEDAFLSDHDWVTHENRSEHILYGTFGRKLVAEFKY